MKNIFLLFSLLLLISCGSDRVKHPAPSANPDAHAGHNHGADDSNITTNSDGTVHVKGDMTAFLVGLWEVEYAIIGTVTKIDARYKGAWIEMNPDFTFTAGIYEQQTNKGTYKFLSDSVRILRFSYDQEEKLLPNEATVKGHSTELLLLGETPIDGKKSQIKIKQINEKPSRTN